MKSKFIYIIKNLTPWMMDELLALSKLSDFSLILLRKPATMYQVQLEELNNAGVNIVVEPFNEKVSFKKVLFVIRFLILNIKRFAGIKNFVFGIKSVWWFLKINESFFNKQAKIHAQFATQAAIISLMCKYYFNSEYSFTFHAHDIYFRNRWLNKLVKESQKSFSISYFNQLYLEKQYGLPITSTQLARLGVNISGKNTFRKPHIPFKVGFLSWFNEKKGINYLLEAITKIVKIDKQIVFELAGDGELFEKTKSWIQYNNLTKSVSLSGRLYEDSKTEFFKKCDLFVLPSIQIKNDMDGIPVALMEAIYWGIPIVSTNISGIPEICITGETGVLIEEKKSDDIVLAILKFKDDKGFYEQCSRGAIAKSIEYDINKNTIHKFEVAGWLTNK